MPEASQFDDHHSFIVRYTASEDLGLDMHTDDSAARLDIHSESVLLKPLVLFSVAVVSLRTLPSTFV